MKYIISIPTGEHNLLKFQQKHLCSAHVSPIKNHSLYTLQSLEGFLWNCKTFTMELIGVCDWKHHAMFSLHTRGKSPIWFKQIYMCTTVCFLWLKNVSSYFNLYNLFILICRYGTFDWSFAPWLTQLLHLLGKYFWEKKW